jgi:gluconokinase
MPAVSLAAAEAPLVLALDMGTSSLRALLFDRQGRAVAGSEEQRSHTLRTTPDGGAETDAAPLFEVLVRCLDGALARAGDRAGEIVAVGTTSFWHSLLGLDAGGEPATPLLMWADTRSAAHAAELRRALDPDAVQGRTGCPLHSSFWPAKLRWLTATRTGDAARVARWVSFAEYAALRLHGEAAVTVSMASGTGLLDVDRLRWDDAVLDAVAIDPARLSPLADDAGAATLRDPFARRWPALARVPWFAALGDGACANVGSGAVGRGRIALTLGTSGALRLIVPVSPQDRLRVEPALWVYRLDRRHAVLGGALSNGGNLMRWLRELLAVDAEVEAPAAALPPDGHGLTLLPFVAGERSPGWHDHAAGVVAGLTLSTRPEHLLRAAIEAVTYRFARIYDGLAPLAAPEHEIVANGGAILESPDRLQLVADVLGHDLLALPPEDEASARGAAAMALVAAEVIPDLAALPDPAAGADRYRPDADRHALYRAARERHERLEDALFPEAEGGRAP